MSVMTGDRKLMHQGEFGDEPVFLGYYDLAFTEVMHWMYLPVVWRGQAELRLPPNVEFLRPMIQRCMDDRHLWWRRDAYVYLTARHGWATPENPINRPGWHTDGFGSNDINYIWADVHGTRFAVHPFERISRDHIMSMRQFEAQATTTMLGDDQALYRLNQFVVHQTPIIPPPGCWRSFVKVSISPFKYNLAGNSHNHLFDYDWEMLSRDEVRNDPYRAGGDAG